MSKKGQDRCCCKRNKPQPIPLSSFILAIAAIIAASCDTAAVFYSKRLMHRDTPEHERLMQECQDG